MTGIKISRRLVIGNWVITCDNPVFLIQQPCPEWGEGKIFIGFEPWFPKKVLLSAKNLISSANTEGLAQQRKSDHLKNQTSEPWAFTEHGSFLSGKEWGLTNTNLRVDPQQLGYTDEHWEFNLESGVTSRTCNEKIQFAFNIIEAGFDKKQKQGFDQRNEPTKEGKIDEGMGS
jgi:hypothetical protein